jgi:alkanesulfonate monooxygenase SsuD/methylene tetrahydromethanopterin reductase-like flavin-dependent oxidoreductase (luciferase family)
VTDRVTKIGVILPMFSGDPGKVIDAARSSEALGFDGVFAFDHFFPPGGPADRPALEAFTTLAAVAEATERVRLGTLVTRAVLRPPGLVAKMMATIDLISEGRSILGIGTGDPIDRPEHDAFGFPNLAVAERRAHLAETVAAIKALFGGRSFDGGEHAPRIEGPLVPLAVQDGGPPVWLGALSDDVVRMAASIADGWNGWGLAPDAFRHKAKLLSEEAERAGRQVEPTWAGIVLLSEDEKDLAGLLESRHRRGMTDDLAWAGPAERFAEYVRDLAEAGATWVIMVLAGPSGRRELLAERVLPLLT